MIKLKHYSNFSKKWVVILFSNFIVYGRFCYFTIKIDFLKDSITGNEKTTRYSILKKPKGKIQKSMFDENKERIEELLNLGLSVRKIAKHLKAKNYNNLNNYINKRKLKSKEIKYESPAS